MPVEEVRLCVMSVIAMAAFAAIGSVVGLSLKGKWAWDAGRSRAKGMRL